MGEPEIQEGETIMLDELIRRMKAATMTPGMKKENRLILLNAAAALGALGVRVEEQAAKIAELTNSPRILGPTGLRRVN